jgi:hypothetical protein
MLREALLVGHLALLLGRVRRKSVVIVINTGTRVSTFALSTSGSTKRVKFSSELGLRLDERSAVVTHWLVTSVGVLREQGEARRDQDHEKEDKGENSVVDEKYDAHDTGYDTLRPRQYTVHTTGWMHLQVG